MRGRPGCLQIHPHLPSPTQPLSPQFPSSKQYFFFKKKKERENVCWFLEGVQGRFWVQALRKIGEHRCPESNTFLNKSAQKPSPPKQWGKEHEHLQLTAPASLGKGGLKKPAFDYSEKLCVGGSAWPCPSPSLTIAQPWDSTPSGQAREITKTLHIRVTNK